MYESAYPEGVAPAHGGRDPALREMVLIGHSQGGMLARLMVTDSGSRFWDNVSTKPLAEMNMTPEVREIVQTSMFFEALPFVKQVIFIATPHRGSFRAAGFVLNLTQGRSLAASRLINPVPPSRAVGMSRRSEAEPR